MVGSVTPARAIRDKAEAMFREGDELAVATDASADPVLIGLATSKHSLVMAVAASEYDGLALAKLCGFELRQQTAMERLKGKSK